MSLIVEPSASVNDSIAQLHINVMSCGLTGRRMIMNTHRPRRFERVGFDGNALLPELRTVVPEEYDQLTWFQRRYGQAMFVRVNGLDGPVKSQSVNRAGITP